MSFLLALGALVLCGLALLHLLRLATGNALGDAALGWFLGAGWFALGASVSRFLLGLAYSSWTALGLLVLPGLALALRWKFARRAPSDSVDAGDTTRWLPRPLGLFVPLLVYALVVLAMTLRHGHQTPTQTDDGLRVRAFAPLLAFADEWPAPARELLPVVGALPTWVPTLGWRLTGSVDPFHVNYAVLASLVALLALLFGLGASRGRPEHAAGAAFALFSLPLFVYHATSTYSDAVLAIHVGAAFLCSLEYARTRRPEDAARAFLLLASAALVKREGLWMAACVAVPLALSAWRAPGPRTRALSALGAGLGLVLIDLCAQLAAVGPQQAFPVLRLFLAENAVAASEVPEASGAQAARVFLYALFRSGNAGMLFWVVLPLAALRLRALSRSANLAPLFALGAQLSLTAASSIWVIPEYTLDESTVHRALLTVSVSAAIFGAWTFAEWLRESEHEGPGPSPHASIS